MNLELIKPKLNRLKLPGITNSLEERLTQAQQGRWSFSQFLDILLADEIERREHKQLGMRLSKSHLEASKSLESFNFAFNDKIYEPLIRELSTCNFLINKENVFLMGPSGVGKSHLAQGLGHAAIRRGHNTAFHRTHQLLQWIYSGHGDGTHRKRLEQIIAIPVLILDDFGLQSLSEKQQDDLYELICERYEKHSTIITSNRDFSEWFQIFSNPLIASAAMDRLVHKAIKVVLEGKSYRMEEFTKRNKKNDKGKTEA